MKTVVSVLPFAFVLLLLTFQYSHSQEIIRLKDSMPPVICHAEYNNQVTSYRGAPDSFVNLRNSGARIKSSTIEVDYYNFPVSAKTAFEYAVSVWESLLTTPVKIRVAAVWTTLPAGALGSAGPSFWVANFKGAPYANIYYPGPLAEKLARTNLNGPNEYDIIAQFSNEADWYFFETGIPGDLQHDFITVALHELCHGLGFTSTFAMEGGNGYYGEHTDGIPFPLDVSIMNGNSTNLYENFTSPSMSLGQQLVSGNVFFNSFTNNSPVKLYAPNNFRPGSSLSHLDALTFPQGSANSLMRPFINTKEVNHDPGLIVQHIFKDIGWVTTYIDHEHISDIENTDAPIEIKAIVETDGSPDYSYNSSSVFLHYFTNFNTDTVKVLMNPTGLVNEYACTIPSPATSTFYYYKIQVEDSYSRKISIPGKLFLPTDPIDTKGPLETLYSFFVGPDNMGPELIHTPKDFISYLEAELEINVEVRESHGISSMQLEYFVNENSRSIPLDLIESAPDPFNGEMIYQYHAVIILEDGLNDGDEITYRINAADNTVAKNKSTSPDSDYYRIPVKGLLSARRYYENDFNSLSDDFIGNSFNISTPDGFINPLLHTVNPYPTAGNNNEIELIHQLRVPIIINESESFMRFDEVVLVEPGEVNDYNHPDFFDFVIVEGSNNNGISWEPLLNGYDSREEEDWMTQYNLDNTTADASLLRDRQINLLNTFRAGDQVIFRFKLYSDPFESAWGWGIDNLHIQDLVTSVKSEEPKQVVLVPNPINRNSSFTIDSDWVYPISFSIINTQGQLIQQGILEEKTLIHTNEMVNGLYLITINNRQKSVVRKLVIAK